jgi:hypothetical protein
MSRVPPVGAASPTGDIKNDKTEGSRNRRFWRGEGEGTLLPQAAREIIQGW